MLSFHENRKLVVLSFHENKSLVFLCLKCPRVCARGNIRLDCCVNGLLCGLEWDSCVRSNVSGAFSGLPSVLWVAFVAQCEITSRIERVLLFPPAQQQRRDCRTEVKVVECGRLLYHSLFWREYVTCFPCDNLRLTSSEVRTEKEDHTSAVHPCRIVTLQHLFASCDRSWHLCYQGKDLLLYTEF